jgi:hypothetical protein
MGSCTDASSIFNDIAEVIPITAIFPHGTVLGDAASCVVVNQATVAAN